VAKNQRIDEDARQPEPIISAATDAIDDVRLRRASEVIAESWRAELKREFPERQFRVTVMDDYGPVVTCSSETTA
jgi:hypothetical protein